MKTFNIYIAIICSLFLFMTTSCDQENIGNEYALDNEGVSFLGSTASITASPDQTSVDYKIIRGNTNGRLELPITATYDQDIFTLPSSVVFDDGSGMAILTIPLEKTVLGVTYTIKLAIDEKVMAQFGMVETTISVMRDYNWVSIGTALWTDGLVCTIFSAPALTYPIKVEKAAEANGIFRMVNPYGLDEYEFNDPEDIVRNPHYIVINAEDPNKVVINRTGLGIDWGYGEFFAGTRVDMYGTFADNVITFPAGTIGVGMPDWSGEDYGAASKICILDMREQVEPEPVYDYSAEIGFMGRFTDPAGKDFAMADVQLGADVESAKVALIAGEWDKDIVDGIINGSIESVEIETSGTISIPCPGQGTFTFVVVTFANDEAQEVAYVTFVFPPIDVNIEDFCGNFILTGTSLFGDPPADMPVSIEEGDKPSTRSLRELNLQKA